MASSRLPSPRDGWRSDEAIGRARWPLRRLGAMDFDLSSEQQEIRKLAQEFAGREIAPGARERDRNQTFPKDVLEKMAPLGLLGGPVPGKEGGVGHCLVPSPPLTQEEGPGRPPVDPEGP